MTELAANSLSVKLNGVQVLEDLSLRLLPGEVVGLIGPNGAGKSTLLRSMLGHIRPDQGDVKLDGHNVLSLSARARARQVAYVPQQSPDGFPVSVFDACLLGRTPHLERKPGGEDVSVVEEMLARLNLTHLAFRTMDRLSGGERQRVMLARALVQQTPFLLLDEPTSALDIGNQLYVLRTLVEMARERKQGMLMAIHDLSLAARFTTRVALLHRGRKLADGNWETALGVDAIRLAYGVEVEIALLRNTPVIASFESGRPA